MASGQNLRGTSSSLNSSQMHIIIDGYICWNGESLITVYRLPIKENKLLFSSCSKQIEVCLSFPTAENKRKLPLSVSSIFCLRKRGDMETWKHGDIDVETWKHEEMEKWRHGDWRHDHGDMDMETWRHQTKNRNESSGNFPYSVYCLLNLQMEVCPLSVVDKEQTEVICLKID